MIDKEISTDTLGRYPHWYVSQYGFVKPFIHYIE